MATKSPRRMAIPTHNRFGWHRDLPDPRDLVPGDKALDRMLACLDRPRPRPRSGGGRSVIPAKTDWNAYFAPVGEQGGLATSVPHACLGLAQYFERRANGRMLDGSVRFLYKMARELEGWEGDVGITPRATLKALTRFGLPPTSLCPENAAEFDRPLEPFLFGYGDVTRSLRYARLDPVWSVGEEVVHRVRSWLAAGFPCLFGFVVFDSMTRAADIACPTAFDQPRGGLAVVATGYDDSHRIRSTRGALRIRNCWGTDWGDGGYGWLPYEYITRGLATDFWTLLRADWLDTEEFQHPGDD